MPPGRCLTRRRLTLLCVPAVDARNSALIINYDVEATVLGDDGEVVKTDRKSLRKKPVVLCRGLPSVFVLSSPAVSTIEIDIAAAPRRRTGGHLGRWRRQA